MALLLLCGAARAESTHVPFRNDNGSLWVIVDFGTGPGECLIDTGSESLAIPVDQLPAAHLHMADGHSLMADNESVSMEVGILPMVTVGRAHEVGALYSTLPPGSPCLLGTSFFEAFSTVTIDYTHDWLVLTGKSGRH